MSIPGVESTEELHFQGPDQKEIEASANAIAIGRREIIF
jgi:hypothetical protein